MEGFEILILEFTSEWETEKKKSLNSQTTPEHFTVTKNFPEFL